MLCIKHCGREAVAGEAYCAGCLRKAVAQDCQSYLRTAPTQARIYTEGLCQVVRNLLERVEALEAKADAKDGR